ncbi:hypothetical protein Tco_0272933 [Tanacetum coccineum]
MRKVWKPTDKQNRSRIGINKCIRAFALKKLYLEVLEFESAHSNTTASYPILKLGEYEMWVIRIKQYFQVQDYALWEVIENGNSWVSVLQTTQENGTSVTNMLVPVTAEEKTNKKNDVKARSLLFMALPNERQLTFSQYNDAKTMFAAIETRFGGSRRFAISGAQNLAFMTVPSTSSINDVKTAKPAYENPNGSNLLQQDLEQIHKDDLEAMDLKWQLSLPKYRQRGQKSHGNNEDTSSKAMLAINGIGFDWSDMEEEQVKTNMALMAFLDSELNQTEFIAATYKRGLATVEEQLITYRKNEVLFSEEVAVLKREVACKDYEINVLKSEFEKVKQEKEGIEFKIEKFDNASKSLNKLLESQITDKSKKGLGYNVVPPPHPLIYNRPKKLDLSYSGLDEFKEPEFKSYGSEDSKKESNIVCDKKSDDSKENSDDSLVKEQVLEDTSSFVESSLNVDKETIFLDKKIEFVKPKNHEKPVKKSVRHVKRGRDTKIPQSSGPPVKVGDEAVHKELGDRMERVATTASSLEAEQNSEFCDKYNMVAHLEKSEGSEGFHEIINFLSASHIHYALTTSPTIYTSLIEQFWQTAALCTIDDRVLGITSTIYRKVKITVLEGSIRMHLKLKDSEGIPSLPTVEIFEQLALMGYVTTFDSLTFQKGHFSPQ